MIGRMASCAAVFSLALGSGQACSLSLAMLNVGSGAGVEVGVLLRSPSGPVGAIQFEIQADPGTLRVTHSAGAAVEEASKTLDSARLGDGRTRFVISGMNGSPIPDGVVAHLAISYVAGAPAGRLPLSLGGLTCSSPGGDEVSGSATAGVAPPAQTASRLRPEGVRNAASLVAGPVATGAAITLLGDDFGPAPEVYFDDYAAAVLYASPNQVNVVAPRQVRPPGSLLRVYSGGELRGFAALQAADLAPGLFTSDSSGTGAALAWNDDGTRNSESQAALRDSTVTVFVTGAGPGERFEATIDGVAVRTIAASEVPGSKGSVVAVRLETPSAAPISGRALILLRAGDFSAQSGVYFFLAGR